MRSHGHTDGGRSRVRRRPCSSALELMHCLPRGLGHSRNLSSRPGLRQVFRNRRRLPQNEGGALPPTGNEDPAACTSERTPTPTWSGCGDWPSPVTWTLGSMDGLLTSVREGPGLRRKKAGRHSGRGGIACGAGRTLKLCLQRVAMAPGVISRLWWLSEGPWGSVGFRLIFVAFYAPYTVSLELWGETLRTLAFFVCLYG